MHLDKEIIQELEQKIPKYSKEEIRSILRKRNHYNPEVAQMAIKEAIKRGIINSESDLVAEEYSVKKLGFRMFPNIEKEKVRHRVIKSLARAVLLVGLIPVIFGFLKIADNSLLHGLILLALGGTWIIITGLFMRTRKKALIYFVMIMAALSAVYVLNLIFKVNPLQFMDLFIALVLFAIVFYCLFYIRFLLNLSLRKD